MNIHKGSILEQSNFLVPPKCWDNYVIYMQTDRDTQGQPGDGHLHLCTGMLNTDANLHSEEKQCTVKHG